MQNIIIKSILISTLLMVSTVSKAGVIKFDDWFDSSGSATAGLTQSTFNSSLFFAVAKDIDFSVGDTYEITEGWRIATFSDYVSLWQGAGSPITDYNHFHRNGWSNYTSSTGSENHFYFAFQDMFDDNLTNKVAHAGNGPQHTATGNWAMPGGNNETWGTLLATTSAQNFAGIVVIQEGTQAWGTSVNVPEPSSLAIFALGIFCLVSRRFKKQF
ncbi:PEP-CTERM sorting domain-containing protein [Thalassotalea maritima]|uniref:PEP-CTERM sorting domain-containing protein n=1 Tax=Thalassotalea maritima TaxID=3242416 RepID=UPI003529C290